MDGDIEQRPYAFVDVPKGRGLTLLGKQDHTPTDEHIVGVTETFDKLQANHPEVLVEVRRVGMDLERGRLAVALGVSGPHETLHPRATEWVQHLGDDETEIRDLTWLIEH